MKISNLISDFEIYTTNEQKELLEDINGLVPMSSFDERQQVIINELIRKSILSKVLYNNSVMVVKNDF
jgi:hypothetical protein